MVDWKKIRAEYIRGGTSYRSLAEKYGVSFSSVKRKALQEKWTDLRRKSEQKSTTRIIESVAKSEAKRVDMFETIADMLLEEIKKTIEAGGLTASRYRDVTGALKDLKDIKGLKSELDMKEQIARIEKLRKEAQTEEQRKDINVVMENSLEDYSK